MIRITTKSYSNNPERVLILAHGAGAPMDSSFMESLVAELDRQGVACVRFEFPYMEKRREDGKKRLPDKPSVLLESFRAELDSVRAEVGSHCRLIIGGKSMGGRMASVLASEGVPGVDGVVCFGYPFHPPGKPDRWRTSHLSSVTSPLLIVQGTRDPFGKLEELQAHGAIDGVTRIHWLDGGDHDFRTPARHALNQSDLIRMAAVATRQFVDEEVGSSGSGFAQVMMSLPADLD